MYILPSRLNGSVCRVSFWHCTKNHISFFSVFREDSLPKETTLKCDISCVMWKDGISSSENILSGWKMKDDIPKEARSDLRFTV